MRGGGAWVATSNLKGCRGAERREGGVVLAWHHTMGGVRGAQLVTAGGGRPTSTQEQQARAMLTGGAAQYSAGCTGSNNVQIDFKSI
jgi:hypothetical protein